MIKSILFKIIIILFFLPFQVYTQNLLSGIVIDASKKEAVPFANIIVENGMRGVVSGIDGTFSFDRKYSEQIFKISCLGYETVIIEVPLYEKFITVHLIPKSYELFQVNVFPGENPALTLMKNVYKNRDKNNHETACDYKCLIYHKMFLYYDIVNLNISQFAKDSVTFERLEKDKDSLNAVIDAQYILLIESVSEKKHIAPDKNNERIISGTTSGLKDPLLADLPTQVQPFTFYEDNINLLDVNYLNPVSRAGLQRYFFNMEDTLLNARGDTLFYISFVPRKNSNIKGLHGSFHIHVPSYGIRTVNASINEELYDFSVKQTYQYIDENQWFPEQLESELKYKYKMFGITIPIIVQSKSSISEVEINPELSKKEFSSVALINETLIKNLPIENFRIEPLTAKDSATYIYWDKINEETNFFNAIYNVNTLKYLFEGFIPFGSFKLDLMKIYGENRYEGTKLGMGIWTSDKISRHISVGGFYNYSFKSDDHNYGAGLKLQISKKADSELNIQWAKANVASGKVEFIGNRSDLELFDFANYFTNSMDMTNSLKGTFSARFLNYFKANLFYQYSEVYPKHPYTFLRKDTIRALSEFSLNEYGVQLRWAHKETFSYWYPFGLFSQGTDYPIIWANINFGKWERTDKFEYMKIEAQIEKRFFLNEWFKSYIRITGGNIWGDVPESKLYALFGLYANNWSIRNTNYFTVMRPNEFAATQFVNAHWRSTFYTRLNKKKFKPEITLSTSAGIGDVNGKYKDYVNTYNEGYYESGIYFGNLLRWYVLKLGVGCNYRYGPYHLSKEFDNWAFLFRIEFGL